jgi:hypothetical protein
MRFALAKVAIASSVKASIRHVLELVNGQPIDRRSQQAEPPREV